MNVNRLNQELARLYGQRTGPAREGAQTGAGGDATNASETTASTQGDAVVLSARVRELRRVVDVIRNLPEVREQRVEQIRQHIADGSYNVSAESLADRLLDPRNS